MTIEQTFDFGRLADCPDGPWTGEPDKVVWIDPATELDCMLLRNKLAGAWCGYVGVPEGHPWFAKPYHELDDEVDVHGGLTFADFCHEGAGDDRICHTPAPGRPAHVWWLGFDCAHAFDIGPLMDKRLAESGVDVGPLHGDGGPEWMRSTYKPLGYARDETTRLAAQAKEAMTT